MKPSNRFDFNNADFRKVIENAAIFLAPALLIFLMEIQVGKTLDEALIALKVWSLSTSIDALRKFVAGK